VLKREDYRNAFIEMAESHSWVDPFAVSLTMRNENLRHHTQNFRHFMNRLNSKVLGNAYKRYGKRLSVLVAKEGGGRDHPHYHCAIDNPFPDQRSEFAENIEKCWSRTELALPEIRIDSITDNGWFYYIAKNRDKDSYHDAFDWENSWLEQRR
jgi:hypothetical protein